MARRLFKFCLAWALLLGCWGGVLAAAVCPHLGCRTAAATPEHADAHDEHPTAEAHESAGHGDHAAHAGAAEARREAPPAVEEPRPGPEVLTGRASSPHDTSCSHCVGRPQAPHPANSEWQLNSARKAAQDSAAQVVRHLPAPACDFVREITPAQHAPPPRPGRHLLLGVFLI